ncbi:ABC transporter permease subunit [Humibacter ginsenosidimutans]|uniref:ABC transporter permease subunit n=1 Tax=Humibacter ginsenosidimutans TaxID=2599293 RepID=UPI00349EEAEC
MSTVILLLVTSLGLGALYFLVSSGLSLIYGLMGVLNFAHGSFLTLGAFLGWAVASAIGPTTWGSLLLSMVAGMLTGAAFAAATEFVLVRRLYQRHIEQVLVTAGARPSAWPWFQGIWGTGSHLTSPHPAGWGAPRTSWAPRFRTTGFC